MKVCLSRNEDKIRLNKEKKILEPLPRSSYAEIIQKINIFEAGFQSTQWTPRLTMVEKKSFMIQKG